MRWDLKTTDSQAVEQLASELRSQPALGLHDPQIASTLARLLVMRGITEAESAERFLAPALSHLHSPYLMAGMKAAIDRIEAAIENQEPILIYGDYDVDGTTAIVILKTAIELCGGTADFHVPHRIRDGYDMRDDVIERAAASGIKLIISVDMGIRAFAPAETARRLGVDLIVTDHHLPGPQGVPAALAVVNPNQSGCEYPCKALCGAGVAFKLAQALIERRIPEGERDRLLKSFMKVVAIATIADAVPLTGENRVFARLGLEGLRSPVNPGLKALIEVAQLSHGRTLTSGEVAFRIAPRINAAGRMDVARDVIELFSVKDPARARELAHKLDQLNGNRQEEERRILQSITAHFEEQPALRDAFCIVIDGEGWHRGVIGITATRVVERYGRPALVISRNGGEAHGSGRSIRAFHLLNALESCAGLFTRFGGHAHAVGFSLPSANLPELRARLDDYARANLTLADFEPSLNFDAELALDQVTPELFNLLQRLEPFGVGNPQPVFAARSVRLMASPRIIKDKHVKLKLAPAVGSLSLGSNGPDLAILTTPRCDPDSAALRRDEVRHATDNRQATDARWRRAITFDALGWQMAERCQQTGLLPGDALDIAFTIDNNDHPEYGGLELSLRDFVRPKKVADDTSSTGLSAEPKKTAAGL
ncbi:MAG TPA: single-stranded-DNA-specific exonuclease RecJ [Terriglobales bacterium]|nr:single-stranded-DNA-specific exonuclease RecJ [Terriglobales bacterium]